MSEKITYQIREGTWGDSLVIYKGRKPILYFECHSGHGYGAIKPSQFNEGSEFKEKDE